MRHMSFRMTTPQMRARTKTVTRRPGWRRVRPGARLQAVVQGQGLKKGERVEKIGVIEVVSVRHERLHQLPAVDLVLEGFPEMTPTEFIALYLQANGGTVNQLVTRIEFTHVG